MAHAPAPQRSPVAIAIGALCGAVAGYLYLSRRWQQQRPDALATAAGLSGDDGTGGPLPLAGDPAGVVGRGVGGGGGTGGGGGRDTAYPHEWDRPSTGGIESSAFFGSGGSGAGSGGGSGSSGPNSAASFLAPSTALSAPRGVTAVAGRPGAAQWSDAGLGVRVEFPTGALELTAVERRAPVAVLRFRVVADPQSAVVVAFEHAGAAVDASGVGGGGAIGATAEDVRAASLQRLQEAECATLLPANDAVAAHGLSMPQLHYCFASPAGAAGTGATPGNGRFDSAGAGAVTYVRALFLCGGAESAAGLSAATVQYTSPVALKAFPTALLPRVSWRAPSEASPSFLLCSEPRLGVGVALPLDFRLVDGGGVEEGADEGACRSVPFARLVSGDGLLTVLGCYEESAGGFRGPPPQRHGATGANNAAAGVGGSSTVSPLADAAQRALRRTFERFRLAPTATGAIELRPLSLRTTRAGARWRDAEASAASGAAASGAADGAGFGVGGGGSPTAAGGASVSHQGGFQGPPQHATFCGQDDPRDVVVLDAFFGCGAALRRQRGDASSGGGGRHRGSGVGVAALHANASGANTASDCEQATRALVAVCVFAVGTAFVSLSFVVLARPAAASAAPAAATPLSATKRSVALPVAATPVGANNAAASGAGIGDHAFAAFCRRVIAGVTLGNHYGQDTALLFYNLRHAVQPFVMLLTVPSASGAGGVGGVVEPPVGDPLCAVRVALSDAEDTVVYVRAFPAPSRLASFGGGVGLGDTPPRRCIGGEMGSEPVPDQTAEELAAVYARWERRLKGMVIAAGDAGDGSSDAAPRCRIDVCRRADVNGLVATEIVHSTDGDDGRAAATAAARLTAAASAAAMGAATAGDAAVRPRRGIRSDSAAARAAAGLGGSSDDFLLVESPRSVPGGRSSATAFDAMLPPRGASSEGLASSGSGRETPPPSGVAASLARLRSAAPTVASAFRGRRGATETTPDRRRDASADARLSPDGERTPTGAASTARSGQGSPTPTDTDGCGGAMDNPMAALHGPSLASVGGGGGATGAVAAGSAPSFADLHSDDSGAAADGVGIAGADSAALGPAVGGGVASHCVSLVVCRGGIAYLFRATAGPDTIDHARVAVHELASGMSFLQVD